MSRGLGRVQQGCLRAIKTWERLTTYDIAAEVYQIEPDADGNRWVDDAQHVAVKRALEGLQRKGLIIGFRMQVRRNLDDPHDGRIELCNSWMTESQLANWLEEQRENIKGTLRAGGRPQFTLSLAKRIAEKAKAIGMSADW